MQTHLKIFLTLFILLTIQGCAKLAPNGPYKGDSTLYHADVVIDGAYKTFDEFLIWEYKHRNITNDKPEIKITADKIRANAERWFDIVLHLRRIYILHPTKDNAANLDLAVDEIQKMIHEVFAAYKLQP